MQGFRALFIFLFSLPIACFASDPCLEYLLSAIEPSSDVYLARPYRDSMTSSGILFARGTRIAPGLELRRHAELDTAFAVQTPRAIPPGARAVVVALGGTTAAYSNLQSVMELLNHLVGEEPLRTLDGGRFDASVWHRIRKAEILPVLAGMSLDIPFHGYGPDSNKFNSLDRVAQWLAQALRQVKRASGLPLIVFTRCGTSLFLQRVIQNYPGLIDLYIGMSPPSTDPSVVNDMVRAQQKLIDAGEIQRDARAFDWTFARMLESTSHRSLRPFGDTPTLILRGLNNREAPASDDRFWHSWFDQNRRQNPNVRFVELEDGSIDVLLASRPETAWAGYQEVAAAVSAVAEGRRYPNEDKPSARVLLRSPIRRERAGGGWWPFSRMPAEPPFETRERSSARD